MVRGWSSHSKYNGLRLDKVQSSKSGLNKRGQLSEFMLANPQMTMPELLQRISGSLETQEVSLIVVQDTVKDSVDLALVGL